MSGKTLALVVASATFLAFGLGAPSVAKEIKPDRKPSKDIVTGLSTFKRQYWKPSFPYGAQETREIARSGNSSLRLELRAGNCGVASDGSWSDCAAGNERIEFISFGRDAAKPGDSVEYGWSFYLPDSFPQRFRSRDTSLTLGQFYGDPGFGSVFEFTIGGWRPGHGGLVTKGWLGTREKASTGIEDYAANILSQRNLRGRWHDIVVRAKWSHGDDGYFAVFLNGKQVSGFRGKTLPKEVKAINFKLGIYRRQTTRNAQTVVIYYDRIYRKTGR